MSDAAFTDLVNRHYTNLYRFALSLARNSADACDLTQQTFFIWATKGHLLRDASKAKTWLFTTLYRQFLHQRRRDGRVTSLEELPPGEDEIADVHIDQAKHLDVSVIMDVLGRLDETFRAPLTLFYLEELSYLEIAATLSLPVGTVMSRLSRGKSLLRAALAEQETRSNVVSFPMKGAREQS